MQSGACVCVYLSLKNIFESAINIFNIQDLTFLIRWYYTDVPILFVNLST